MDDVLDVLLIQQLQLHQHVRPQPGEPATDGRNQLIVRASGGSASVGELATEEEESTYHRVSGGLPDLSRGTCNNRKEKVPLRHLGYLREYMT